MKILFVANAPLGDAVLSTGVMGAILDENPGARVTVAAGPVSLPLFAAMPGLERVISLERSPRLGHWRRLWRAAIGTRWDLVVDLRSSATPFLLRARRRLIFRGNSAPEHRVRQLARLIGRERNPPAPLLWASPADRAEASRLVPSDRPVLAVGPTAAWPQKRWNGDHFIETIRRLLGPGGRLEGGSLAVVAAPGERSQAAPWLECLPPDRVIDLVGRASLPVLGQCLGRSSLYIGNDSGLMHLAAASGVPTIGVFGPTDERHYSPWGPACMAIRGPRSRTEIMAELEASQGREGGHMSDLLPERAIAAAATLLDRRPVA